MTMNVELQNPTASTISCPDCQSDIPNIKGFVTWCECGYNINLKPSEKPKSKLEKMHDYIGDKMGQRIFNGLIQKDELFPEKSSSKLLAFLIATCIHFTSIIAFIVGVYFLVFQYTNYISVAAGLCLLAITWIARPRIPKLAENEHLIKREEYPSLFTAVDELANAMNVKSIDGIVIDDRLNASVTYIGWKRKKIITIGYPLFSILEPEEQLAILAHEFGHIANGDLTRTFYIGTALFTLEKWHQLLEPVPLEERENMGFFELPAYYFMALCAQVPYLIYYSLIHLLFVDKQKGEYLADYRAAKACGYEYLISSLKKFDYNEIFYSTIREIAITRSKNNLFHHLQKNITSMPDREKERLSHISMLEASKLDSTHPPTFYRIKMLEKLKASPSHFPIKRETLVNIGQELDTQQAAIQEQLIEDFRYRLSL